MNLTDLATTRLISQHILGTKFKSAKDVVSWMGAMQAQDFSMAKWAIGIRLPGSTEKLIQEAINKGEIIRTHLLRPTWHFVSAEDIYWLLELTAPHIKSRLKSRHRQLGLTKVIFKKSCKVIEKALQSGKHLTRDELMTELKKVKLDVSENRSSHFMLMAELEGIICSGKAKGDKQTYALFEERIPKKISLKREEALDKLARKYFKSHGPATIQDFMWWSGLPAADAKKAMEPLKSEFNLEKIDSKEYWFDDFFSNQKKSKQSVFLLPAYDEFIISYKDRNAVLDSIKFDKIISNNGIFRPVIIVNGIVAGIWKRIIQKDEVKIEIEIFELLEKSIQTKIVKASSMIGNFLEKKSI